MAGDGNMIDIDKLAETYYASRDPQFQQELTQSELDDIAREKIDEAYDLIHDALSELEEASNLTYSRRLLSVIKRTKELLDEVESTGV